MSLQLKCPTCNKKVEWSKEYSFRPFCSKRCQLIDFGEWTNGNYKIPDKNKMSLWQQDEIDE